VFNIFIDVVFSINISIILLRIKYKCEVSIINLVMKNTFKYIYGM
jgi:hypothetical protein